MVRERGRGERACDGSLFSGRRWPPPPHAEGWRWRPERWREEALWWHRRAPRVARMASLEDLLMYHCKCKQIKLRLTMKKIQKTIEDHESNNYLQMS